ncbi:MAG: hypothetical protein LDL41_11915 [Coleofasciculus sp. S288]|nr:hypothetical protein [Coleofasciculus sp. S288]
MILVIQEIEYVLAGYSEYPYQVAFSIPEWRNKLILDVLNQIPNYYTILEDTEELPTDAQFLYASQQEQVLLETLIRESIADIFEEMPTS